MYFEGYLKLEGDGTGVLFISPKGEQIKYVLQILWNYPITRPSMRHSCMGYAWRSLLASSDYLSMMTPYWLLNKSTRSGIATKKPWTHT
jgi:hypothetical protein